MSPPTLHTRSAATLLFSLNDVNSSVRQDEQTLSAVLADTVVSGGA